MKILKIIFEIISWLGIGFIAVIALYIVTSNLNIFLGYRSFLVQSGSMEPAIMTGDIIVAHDENRYYKNDVVTFINIDKRIVTHRIIDIIQQDGKNLFITKGDANRSEDNDSINNDQIIGKVAMVIPKLGYMVAFSKSLPGLILLVLFPCFLIIINEVFKVINA